MIFRKCGSIQRAFARLYTYSGPQCKRKRCFPPLIGSSVVVGTYFGFLLLTDNERPPTFYPDTINATLIRRFPFNGISKLMCWFAECRVPVTLRSPLFSLYSWLYQCDLGELKIANLREYSSLSKFFTREIDPSFRPIHQSAALVSPSDGRIIHFGPIDPVVGVLEQIKGVHYSMKEFLGPVSFKADGNTSEVIKCAQTKTLYQCVIYLAPGDCHRFYNPSDWTASIRRYFPGKLISVRPQLTSRLPGLFALNERVVYLGDWSHGFMSFSAVGALGVGGIHVNIDQQVTTNSRKVRSSTKLNSQPYEQLQLSTPLDRGDELGQFRFGSTIVLIFEAPSNVEWAVQPGDSVRFGQALLYIPTDSVT